MYDTIRNSTLAYNVIPLEKPDIVYLLKEPTEQGVVEYNKFNVRIVN